jgi:adenosylcobinamide-phosphate guanylyltransferase
MIYGILMCGGEGTRIKSTMGPKIEKPLIRIKNKPLIEYLLDTLIQINKFDKIFAAVSNNTQKTREFIKTNFQRNITILDTPGIGYSEDYVKIIKYFKDIKFEKQKDPQKILFLPIDIPLISPKILIQIINTKQEKPCLMIILEKEFVKNHGVTPSYECIIDRKKYCYSGISVIDISKIDIDNSKEDQLIEEEYIVLNYSEIACNINTFEDLKITEKLLENSNNQN